MLRLGITSNIVSDMVVLNIDGLAVYVLTTLLGSGSAQQTSLQNGTHSNSEMEHFSATACAASAGLQCPLLARDYELS